MNKALLEQARDLKEIMNKQETALHRMKSEHQAEIQSFDSSLLDEFGSKVVNTLEKLHHDLTRLTRTQKAMHLLNQQRLLESLDGVLAQLQDEENQQKTVLRESLTDVENLITVELEPVHGLLFDEDQRKDQELMKKQVESVLRQADQETEREPEPKQSNQYVDHVLLDLLKVHPLAPKQASGM